MAFQRLVRNASADNVADGAGGSVQIVVGKPRAVRMASFAGDAMAGGMSCEATNFLRAEKPIRRETVARSPYSVNGGVNAVCFDDTQAAARARPEWRGHQRIVPSGFRNRCGSRLKLSEVR